MHIPVWPTWPWSIRCRTWPVWSLIREIRASHWLTQVFIATRREFTLNWWMAWVEADGMDGFFVIDAKPGDILCYSLLYIIPYTAWSR